MKTFLGLFSSFLIITGLLSLNTEEKPRYIYFGNQKEPIAFIKGIATLNTPSGRKEFEIIDSQYIFCKSFMDQMGSDFFTMGLYKRSTDTFMEVIQVPQKHFPGEFIDSVVIHYIYKKHGNWAWNAWGQCSNGLFHFGKQLMPWDSVVYLADFERTFLLKDRSTKFTIDRSNFQIVSNKTFDTLRFWKIKDFENWENGQYVRSNTAYSETYPAINRTTRKKTDTTYWFSSYKRNGDWVRCKNGIKKIDTY